MLKALVAEVSVKRARLDLGRQRRERNVTPTVVHEIGVDLVGDDDPVVREGDLRERLEFAPLEDAAGRVLRIAEQQDARGRIDRREQLSKSIS